MKYLSLPLHASQWIDILADEELPAITSMTLILDKFDNDDVSSIPKLSEMILHDQSLSSRLLKVANSAMRSQRKQVTTVSRAAIVLGIQTVKNICLTAKVLDHLLKNQDLPLAVYDRLMMLMANGFYAGQLARMMVPDLDDSTQEEIYLAAMMHHIGETAFWCTGASVTEELIEQSDLPDEEFKRLCAAKIGAKFSDLSIGIAKRWNLGEMLSKSLEHAHRNSSESKVINLANRLSALTSDTNADKESYDRVLQEISSITGHRVPVLMQKIEHTRQYSMELLKSYGASVLNSYINAVPTSFDQIKDQPKAYVEQPVEESSVLNAIKALSQLVKDSSNINDFLVCTLRAMGSVLHFQQSAFWVISKDRKSLDTRVTYDDHGEVLKVQRSISLSKEPHILNHILQQSQPTLIEHQEDSPWARLITEEATEFVMQGPLSLATIRIGDKPIGLISVRQLGRDTSISEQRFSHFCFIVDHLNFCLAHISRR